MALRKALEVHSLYTTNRCLLMVKYLWRYCPSFPRSWLSDCPPSHFSCAQIVTSCESNPLRTVSSCLWQTYIIPTDQQRTIPPVQNSIYHKKKKKNLNFLWSSYSRKIERCWDKESCSCLSPVLSTSTTTQAARRRKLFHPGTEETKRQQRKHLDVEAMEDKNVRGEGLCIHDLLVIK